MDSLGVVVGATPCRLLLMLRPIGLALRGRLSPFAGGECIVPLTKGDGREAAGGRFQNSSRLVYDRRFCTNGNSTIVAASSFSVLTISTAVPGA